MNSSFCAQARLLNYLSLCDDFSFPKWFASLHPTYRTPCIFMIFLYLFFMLTTTDIAVITLGFISFIMSLLPFQTIVSFVVFLASISIIITFVCLIRLRVLFPSMERPFKVPFGIVGLVYPFNFLIIKCNTIM